MTYRSDDVGTVLVFSINSLLLSDSGKLVELQPTLPMLIDGRASAWFDQATAMLGIRANGVCRARGRRLDVFFHDDRLVNLRRQIGSGAIK